MRMNTPIAIRSSQFTSFKRTCLDFVKYLGLGLLLLPSISLAEDYLWYEVFGNDWDFENKMWLANGSFSAGLMAMMHSSLEVVISICLLMLQLIRISNL